MNTQQQDRYEQCKQAERRRTELLELIACGEGSLLATADNRTRRSLNHKLTEMRNELQRVETELTRTVRESFHEFKARMNCECIELQQGDNVSAEIVPGYRTLLGAGCFLFRNGAWSDGRSRHSEPPTEDKLRLPLEIAFLGRALVQAQRRANKLKHYIDQQADIHSYGAGPLPEARAYEDLKQLQLAIDGLQRDLDSSQLRFEKLRGRTGAQAYYEKRNREQQAGQAAIQRADAIALG